MEDLKYVLVRTEKAGAHLGYLSSIKAKDGVYYITLTNSRRIWSWSGANSLTDLALKGTNKHNGCKITSPISQNMMVGIEILDVSEVAKKSLDLVPEWTF